MKRQPCQWIKVIRYGCALDNPGKIGAESILRDHEGNLILEFFPPLVNGTKNHGEIGAAIFGLSWALELGHIKIIFEMDSILTVRWILQKNYS